MSSADAWMKVEGLKCLMVICHMSASIAKLPPQVSLNSLSRQQRSTSLRTLTTVGLYCAISASGPALADDSDPSSAASWLKPSLVYDGAIVSNFSGGVRRGSAFVGNLHLQLTATGSSGLWQGTTAFLDVLNVHGGRPSLRVGDAQGVSNIEGPPGTQVEEFWIQHNFAGNTLSMLAGIYDLNSEFYRLRSAGLFVNSSFGLGPEFAQSGVSGPSIFPRTSGGLRIDFKPSPQWVLRAALIDGVPIVRPDGSREAFRSEDGLLGVTEIAWGSRPPAEEPVRRSARDRIGRFSALPSFDDKFAVGVWRYTARRTDLSDTDSAGTPVLRRGTSGAYVVGEIALVRPMASSPKQLAAFAQLGAADASTNRFSTYVGAGLIGSGWGLGRDVDQLGISVAHAVNGGHYLRSQRAQGLAVSRAETTVEMTYLAALSKQLTVQPDLQYVRHPNTNPSVSSAWVLQLRLAYSF